MNIILTIILSIYESIYLIKTRWVLEYKNLTNYLASRGIYESMIVFKIWGPVAKVSLYSNFTWSTVSFGSV